MTQTSNTSVSRALTSFSIVVLFAAGCFSGNALANQNRKTVTPQPKTTQDEPPDAMELPGVFKATLPADENLTQKQTSRIGVGKRVSEQPVDIDPAKGSGDVKRGDRKNSQSVSSPKPVNKTEAKIILIPKNADTLLVEKSDADDFHATAYCLKGRTATGERIRQGFIAADPRVLPLGTMVHIEAGKYTGVYKVADTGGSIRGRRIDIYIPNAREAKLFGRKRIKVKVIKHK